MEGLGTLILICFAITFGPPLLFFILGISRRKKDPKHANVMFILGALWLIIGGGICATIMG